MARKLTALERGIREGYRSGLEDAVAEQLVLLGIPVDYETVVVPYAKPVTQHRYTADFLLPNGILIETKGRFTTADRKKHKYIRDQWPGLDLRFVFSNPNTRISKRSKTTYGMWCEHEGFLFAKAEIPIEWIREPFQRDRWDAAIVFRKAET